MQKQRNPKSPWMPRLNGGQLLVLDGRFLLITAHKQVGLDHCSNRYSQMEIVLQLEQKKHAADQSTVLNIPKPYFMNQLVGQ